MKTTYKIQTTDVNGNICKIEILADDLESAISAARKQAKAFKLDVSLYEDKEAGYEQVYCYSSVSDEEHFIR